MSKTLGILMVILSSLLFTYIKADDMKRRLENIKQLKRGLGIIKNEIMFSSREMGDIALELSETLEGDLSFIFKGVAEKMRENTHISFGQAWEERINIHKNVLPERAVKIMNDFSYMAGKMSKEIEISNIEKTMDILDEETKEEFLNYTKNRKLIFSLGAISALSVTILFL